MTVHKSVSRDIVAESFRRAEMRGSALPEEVDLPFCFINNRSSTVSVNSTEHNNSQQYLETVRDCALGHNSEKQVEEECELSTKGIAPTWTKRENIKKTCTDLQVNVGSVTVLSTPRTLRDSDSTLLTNTGDLVSASLLLSTALQR